MRTQTAKNLCVLLLTLALCAMPNAEAKAFEWSTITKPFKAVEWSAVVKPLEATFDILVLRPLGLITFVSGSALLVPAVVMSAPTGKPGFDEAVDIFFTTPRKDVFERELGDLQ